MLLLFLWLYLRRKPRKRKRLKIIIQPARRNKPRYQAPVYYQQPRYYAAQQKQIERQHKQLERERKQTERERAQDAKRAAQIKQAEFDVPFYESQLDDYMRLHRDAAKLLDAAQSEVDIDNALNEHGAVISIKVHSKHVAARDRYKKAVLQYERHIHTAQKNLDKAKQILNQAGDD